MKTVHFEIIRSSPRHALACAELDQQASGADGWHPEDFRNLRRFVGFQWWVALDDDGEVIGTVVFAEGSRSVIVYKLVVVPGYRRAGVGSGLFDAVRACFAGTSAAKVIALIPASSHSGRKFLESKGFQQVREFAGLDQSGPLGMVAFAGIPRRSDI